MTLGLRAVTSDDVPVLLYFARDLAAFERVPDAVEATEPMLLEALFGPAPAAKALIAEWDGQAVGSAVFCATFSNWAGRRGLQMDDLYVSPKSRRRGIGAAFLKRLAGPAVERGCARFERVVLDWHGPAVELYRAQGAVPQVGRIIQRGEGEALVRLADTHG